MASKNRLTAIDMLRGVAVLAVLFYHLPHSSRLNMDAVVEVTHSVFPRWVEVVARYGQYGVQLFLVISGFCIHMQWARRAATGGVDVPLGFASFWKRRLRRLYPPYFVALLISLAALFFFWRFVAHARGLAASFGYASTRQLVIDAIFLVLLLQNINGASERVRNAPFWSLALEEQLYMLYFPLLWLRRRWGWSRALTVAAAATMVWRLAGVVLELNDARPECWYLVGPARWLDWGLGALAVEAHLGLVKLPRWCASWLAALGALAVAVASDAAAQGQLDGLRHFVLPQVSGVAFALAFFMFINAACAAEQRLRAFSVVSLLAWFGVWSYSLYLVQEPILLAMKQVALRLHFGTAGVVLTRFSVTLVCAYVFYRVVERRFMNPSAGKA